MAALPRNVTHPRSRLAHLLWIAVTAGLVLYTALTLWLAFAGMFFPYQLDYGEGIVLWFVRQLADGQPIYNPLGEPYVSSNYPPVFMLLNAPFDALFGATYIWGRWLSFAAAVVTTAFLLSLARAETRNWRIAWVTGLLFFGSTFIYHWVPLYRVDMTGLGLTVAGIWCIWRWERIKDRANAAASLRGQLGWLAGALVLFLLALYTKHSLLFAPAAASTAIFLRDRRAAVGLVLALGGLGGAIFVGMEWLTRGGWSFGLIASNATVWSLGVFLPLMQSFLVTYAVLFVLAFWSWSVRVRNALRARNLRGTGVLDVYFVAALGSLVLAGREGAWENYFLEAVFVVCLYAGFACARLVQLARVEWALPLLLLAQLVLFWDEHDPRIAQNLFDQVRLGNEHLAPLVRASEGTIISEDMGLLVTNGQPVRYYTFPYSTLARAGRWDQHWELENLRAGKFPLVILMQGTRADVDQFGNFTRAFLSALDANYAVQTEDVRYQVYAPAPLQFDAPRAAFGDMLELAGWSLDPLELQPGKTLVLTTLWHTLQKPGAHYTAFAHLENATGAVIAQDDHEPLHATYPTTRWALGEQVRDTFHLAVPAELPPGDYVLRIGWYDSITQDRLPVGEDQDSIVLEKFSVR